MGGRAGGFLKTSDREAGGRIYFAKDALAGPDTVRAMYPEHDAWLKSVSRIDPDQNYMTDIVRRLNLRSA